MTEKQYKAYLKARDEWSDTLKTHTEANIKADIARVSTDVWYYLTCLRVFYEETGAGDMAKALYIKTVDIMRMFAEIEGEKDKNPIDTAGAWM